MTSKIQNIRCEIGLENVPDSAIDLVVTSPPYGGLRKYNGFEWDFEQVADLLFLKVKQGGVVCWNTDDQIINGKSLLLPERQLLYFCDNGFRLWDTIFWQKHGVPCPTPKRYYKTVERVFVLSKGEPNTFNPICDRLNISEGRKEITYKRQSRTHRERSNKPTYITDLYGRRTNVWTYVPLTNPTNHPAVMPELLAGDLIKSYSNEGDLICDPFMGSGTTAVAAEKLNRKWFGFEVSKEYHTTANNRLNQVSSLVF